MCAQVSIKFYLDDEDLKGLRVKRASRSVRRAVKRDKKLRYDRRCKYGDKRVLVKRGC